MQVAALELKVAARPANFMETQTLQRSNKPLGCDGPELVHSSLKDLEGSRRAWRIMSGDGVHAEIYSEWKDLHESLRTLLARIFLGGNRPEIGGIAVKAGLQIKRDRFGQHFLGFANAATLGRHVQLETKGYEPFPFFEDGANKFELV